MTTFGTAVVIIVAIVAALIVTNLVWGRKVRDWWEKKFNTKKNTTALELEESQQNNNKALYWFASAAVLLGMVLILLVLWISGGTANIAVTIPSFLFEPVEVKWSLIIVFVLAITALKSYKQVEPDEQAALVFLGRALFNVPSGPMLAWWILAKLVFTPKQRLQREFPTDTENIWRGETAAMPMDGRWVEPYRVPTGGKDELKKGDSPLDRRLTVDVSFFIAWRIIDPRRFIRVVGLTQDENGTWVADVEEGFRQLQDTAKRVLLNEFGKRSPRRIVEGQADIALALATALNDLIETGEHWGATLDEVALSSLDLSKRINQALADVPKALFDAQAAIATGQGKAQVIFLTGKQEAAVKKLMLRAEAEGYAKFAADLKVPEEDVIAFMNARLAEAALGKAGENGKIVIVGGGQGVNNILGLVEGLKGAA